MQIGRDTIVIHILSFSFQYSSKCQRSESESDRWLWSVRTTKKPAEFRLLHSINHPISFTHNLAKSPPISSLDNEITELNWLISNWRKALDLTNRNNNGILIDRNITHKKKNPRPKKPYRVKCQPQSTYGNFFFLTCLCFVCVNQHWHNSRCVEPYGWNRCTEPRSPLEHIHQTTQCR